MSIIVVYRMAHITHIFIGGCMCCRVDGCMGALVVETSVNIIMVINRGIP